MPFFTNVELTSQYIISLDPLFIWITISKSKCWRAIAWIHFRGKFDLSIWGWMQPNLLQWYYTLSYVESTIYPLRKSGKKRNHKLEWMDDALEDPMKDSMTEYSGRIHRMDLVLGSKMESLSVPEGVYEKFQKQSKQKQQKQQKSITLNQKRSHTTRLPYLLRLDHLFQLVF